MAAISTGLKSPFGPSPPWNGGLIIFNGVIARVVLRFSWHKAGTLSKLISRVASYAHAALIPGFISRLYTRTCTRRMILMCNLSVGLPSSIPGGKFDEQDPTETNVYDEKITEICSGNFLISAFTFLSSYTNSGEGELISFPRN